MARGEDMLVEKITKEFVLSKNDKQAIKNNAQKIKNFLAKMGYNSCADFFDIYCDKEIGIFLDNFENLPFSKEEREYFYKDDIEQLVVFIDSVIENVKSCITKDDFANKDDLIEHIHDKYTNYDLINKILEVCDEKTLNKIIN